MTKNESNEKNESNKMKITSESNKKNQLNLPPIIYSFDST